MVTRRRFIQIAAALGSVPLLGSSARATPPITRWTGFAMGAQTSIALAHPDESEAWHIITDARAEIARLEAIFSLYRIDSAISRLNRDGRLDQPPFDLLSLLSLAGGINSATQRAFDPTVQPLWRFYSTYYARPETNGDAPDPEVVARLRERTGWASVKFDGAAVRFAMSGMEVTLNGIAQGYATDRVADLLRGEGLSNVLVNVGEICALGRHPEGRSWRAGIALRGDQAAEESIEISDTALATTSPLGTVLDGAGTVSHIIDPRTGEPGGLWRRVSVLGPSAAIADGLSTAFALMDADAILRSLRHYPGYRIIAVDAESARLDLTG